MQCRYNVILRRVNVTIVAVEKQYFESVFLALYIQHGKSWRRIILSSVASRALACFSTLSHKRYDFQEKKVIEH